MSLRVALRRALWLLLPFSIVTTVYLYFYPIFHGCTFPSADATPTDSFRDTLARHLLATTSAGASRAPFRLLALGDPQIEGNPDYPSPTAAWFPSLVQLQTESGGWKTTTALLRSCASTFVFKDIPRALRALRKAVDLVGNDYYLAHVYRSTGWWTQPTHVTVLGDLLGSQWIGDEEFAERGRRYWERIFRDRSRLEDAVIEAGPQMLGQDSGWDRWMVNVVGNHDIGYAGDLTWNRVERFQRIFGRVNWDIRLRLSPGPRQDQQHGEDGQGPSLRLVVLNSLNLDGPVVDRDLQGQTYDFLNGVIGSARAVEDKTEATILLTHLPLHKDAGICVDGPMIAYNRPELGGGVREQNHLSPDGGRAILEGIFGMSGDPTGPGQGRGRPGIILTGHDHEGCDVYHHVTEENGWRAQRWSDEVHSPRHQLANASAGIREITVRSMMGSFSGNAGLLSGWFDAESQRWRFSYATCSLGVQHIWWTIHIVDLVTLACVIAYGSLAVSQALSSVEQVRSTGPSRHASRGSRRRKRGSKHGNHAGLDITDGLGGRDRPGKLLGRTPLDDGLSGNSAGESEIGRKQNSPSSKVKMKKSIKVSSGRRRQSGQ